LKGKNRARILTKVPWIQLPFFQALCNLPSLSNSKALLQLVQERPFNGMLVTGTHEEDPGTQATTIRLWEWENRLPLPSVTTTMEKSPSALMNTTTMTNTCTSGSNATTAGG
jgi:hypothetical protein